MAPRRRRAFDGAAGPAPARLAKPERFEALKLHSYSPPLARAFHLGNREQVPRVGELTMVRRLSVLPYSLNRYPSTPDPLYFADCPDSALRRFARASAEVLTHEAPYGVGMSEASDLWGQRGWASTEVVGESHYTSSIKALIATGIKGDGAEMTAAVQLLPEPLNKHDRHAVGVWAGSRQIGYLSRQDAIRYSPVLLALVARGWTPQVSAQIWAQQWSAGGGDRGSVSASVRLQLAEPHMLVPANQPPDKPHRLLPAGAAVQVTGEEKHLDALAPWLRPEGECWVYATLHEVTEELARSSRTVVEVRVDGVRVGQLTPRMSGDMLPALRHLGEGELTTAARAIVKGNRIKAEVVLYAARAHDLPASWLDAAASPATQPQRPARMVPPPAPMPTAPTPAPVIPAATPVLAAEPVVTPLPPTETGAGAPLDAAAELRFNAPPNWPAPPPGWKPPTGWAPDPTWGPAPPGWQLWITDETRSPVSPPVAVSPPPLVPQARPPVHATAPAPTPALTNSAIPLFGARGKARELATEAAQLRAELDDLRARMNRLGLFRIEELEEYRRRLEQEIVAQETNGRAETCTPAATAR